MSIYIIKKWDDFQVKLVAVTLNFDLFKRRQFQLFILQTRCQFSTEGQISCPCSCVSISSPTPAGGSQIGWTDFKSSKKSSDFSDFFFDFSDFLGFLVFFGDFSDFWWFFGDFSDFLDFFVIFCIFMWFFGFFGDFLDFCGFLGFSPNVSHIGR